SVTGIGTTITNFGTILVDASGSWSLAGSNSLANGTSLSLASGATFAVVGTVRTGKSVTIVGGGELVVAPGTGKLQIGSGATVKAGQITVDPKSTLNATGTLGSVVLDNGRINAGVGTLTLGAATSGKGVIGIDANSALDANGRLAVSTVSFLA